MDLTAMYRAGAANYASVIAGKIQRSLTAQLWKVMRLTTIIILAASLHVSATGLGQKVTLSFNNAPLKTVLFELNKQTGYNFLYSEEVLANAKKVTIQVKDLPLNEVLKLCFQDQPLEFLLQNNSFIIRPKKNAEPTEEEKNMPPPPITIKGRLLNENGDPVYGASIIVKGNKSKGTSTDINGYFELKDVDENATLVISAVNIESFEWKVEGKTNLNLTAKIKVASGEEVVIANNGYQQIPKERSTGSFEIITKEQLQHSNDPNLLKRLEGLSSTFNFNNQLSPTNSASANFGQSSLLNMTIRGKNTLTSTYTADASATANLISNPSGLPLVVIDGIPSPYPIENVNPDIVETITILRDAASASIWGSRSANGVIVITTKKGKFNQPAKISFRTDINVTEKMDLFYKKLMSVSDYIDAEIIKYNAIYNPSTPSAFLADPSPNGQPITQPLRTPVFEILNKAKRGLISQADATSQINALRGNDIRRDYTEYFLRNSVNQNYSINITAGTKMMSHSISGRYTRSLNNTIGSERDGLTFNYITSIRPAKGLEFSGSLAYGMIRTTGQHSKTRLTGDVLSIPYNRLADDLGNPIAIPFGYRPAFMDMLKAKAGDKILPMDYIPLEDFKKSYTKTNNQNVNIGFNTHYQLNKELSGDLIYNYSKGTDSRIEFLHQDSWYLREQINYYTNPTTYQRQFPMGAVYQPTVGKYLNQSLRGMITYNKTWAGKNELTIMAAMDANQTEYKSERTTFLGYNEKTLASTQNLDYVTFFPTLYINSTLQTSSLPISSSPLMSFGISSIKTRSASFSANMGYSYDKRYNITASIRNDGSNEFGTGTNKWNSPFYSVGLGWNIHNEHFYHWSFMPKIAFRGNFGYNGNNNPQQAASALIYYYENGNNLSNGITGFNYAELYPSSVSNKLLRAERIGMLNLGLDFGFKNNRVSGVIEYYQKTTKDLITNSPVDPSTGFTDVTMNAASLFGYGVDFSLNSINIKTPKFNWTTTIAASLTRVKVTDIFNSNIFAPSAGNYASGNLLYTKGDDLERLFAYRSPGLNPQNGYPMGYLANGNLVTIDNTSAGSTNFLNINDGDAAGGKSPSLKYMGSKVPRYQIILTNAFRYGKFTISPRIIAKLDYVFRRGSRDLVRYSDIFSTNQVRFNIQPAEYAARWKQPGDERYTRVPVLTSPGSNLVDLFYQLSEYNVLKGDHVRLQEVNFDYAFGGEKSWFVFKNPKLSVRIPTSDVILWRANRMGLDPEVLDYRRPKTFGVGFSANF